uniref:Keratinocyte differentiation factor 1 n=1 Tax=Knipowitschia caucasica TaxID=637954 RepID=A0AAV2K344_KNICA
MSVGSSGSPVRYSGSSISRHGFSRSSSQRSSYEERCVDPVETLPYTQQPQSAHKSNPRDANGNKCETIGFIPGSADPASPSCNPCASPKRCRSVVCTVLTCGLYRFCQNSTLAPCLAPNESSPDEPEKVSLRNAKGKVGAEEDGKDWLNDVHIGGVRVEESIEYSNEPRFSASRLSSTGAITSFSHSSLHQSLVLDDWEQEDVEDVDSLITKKLLELYSEYQIEELARCTTDSVFLRKTKDIHQLINSLAEEHRMDEQEAECRLVRGIIRISTRKSKKKPHVSKRERTLSDSGHETMKESGSTSFSNNSQPSVSSTSYSPSSSSPSSGVPLIRSAVRT